MKTTQPQVMDAATKEALMGSIEHWRRLSEGRRYEGECLTTADCPLCARFYNKNTMCWGCPVRCATGHGLCANSPYEKASETVREYGFNSEEFKAAAKLELEFLESLAK